MNRFDAKKEKNFDIKYQIGLYHKFKNYEIFVYPAREGIYEDDDEIDILINKDFAIWDCEMNK